EASGSCLIRGAPLLDEKRGSLRAREQAWAPPPPAGGHQDCYPRDLSLCASLTILFLRTLGDNCLPATFKSKSGPPIMPLRARLSKYMPGVHSSMGRCEI